MITPTNTPWGVPQTQKPGHIDGIELYSTAGHGGAYLTPRRWREFIKALPGVFSYAGAQWLEEDADEILIYAVWPAKATPEQCSAAIKGIENRYRAEIDLDYYNASEAGKLCRRKAEAWREGTKHHWKRGSLGTKGKGWTVSFSRGEETKVIHCLLYPDKSLYTEKELITLQADPYPDKARREYRGYFYTVGYNKYSRIYFVGEVVDNKGILTRQPRGHSMHSEEAAEAFAKHHIDQMLR